MRFKVIFLLISGLVLVRCAGSQGSVRFDKMKYPVSASAYLEKQPGKPQGLGREVILAERFEYTYHHWAIVYSFVPLSNTDTLAEELNREIEKHSGVGAVNVRFRVTSCRLNTFSAILLLPIFPGCSEVVMRADIVREK
jgi:hypothetical protein